MSQFHFLFPISGKNRLDLDVTVADVVATEVTVSFFVRGKRKVLKKLLKCS